MSENDAKKTSSARSTSFDDDDASEATVVSSAPSELLAQLRQARAAHDAGEKVQSPTGEELVDPQQLSMPTPLGSFAIVELDRGWDETTPVEPALGRGPNWIAQSDATPRAPATAMSTPTLEAEPIAEARAERAIAAIAALDHAKAGRVGGKVVLLFMLAVGIVIILLVVLAAMLQPR